MANTAEAHSKPMSVVTAPLVNGLVFVGETWALAFRSLGLILRARVTLRETIVQMASIGADSLPMAALITVSTGGVVAFYVSPLFVRFGATSLAGGTLTLAFLLELGPLLTGLTLAARSGAAIAAEIGSMVVTEQVDALRALAVSPERYLVAPRVLACLIMAPIVGLFADAAGLLGSVAMSSVNGIAPQTFFESLRAYVMPPDFVNGLVKTVWFGFTVAVVASYQGLRTRGGAAGVGSSTTRSVVLCVVLIFVSDFFLAQVLSGATISGR